MAATNTRLAIAVHGGAFTVPDSLIPDVQNGAKAATLTGWRVLTSGGSALDAVEAAVIALEDWPSFNAGTGSSLTCDGSIEMDAFLMDGRDQRIGAVGSVTSIRNPIRLARAIMDQTKHCLFVGKEADDLAVRLGFERIDPSTLHTSISEQRLRDYRQFETTVSQAFNLRSTKEPETVGAVAVDQYGNVAAATSTGGITGKLRGRVGDTPLSGSGGWADNGSCAISTTGHGESILRVCLAHRCALNYANGSKKEGPSWAAKEALEHMKQRINGAAGMIVVDPEGRLAVEFSTERMVWAYCRQQDGGLLHWGVRPGEDFTEATTQ